MFFKSDPYKTFFPLAILNGIWSSAFWVLNYFHLSSRYPGQEHAVLMIGGFFLCAVSGFLLTASPRFTMTKTAAMSEKLILFVPFLVLPFSTLFESDVPSLFLILVALLGLCAFFFRRYLKRRNEPAESFLLIGYALSSATIAIFLMILSSQNILDTQFGKFGRYYFLHTFPLMIILGVGSRILVTFNGWDPQPKFPFFLNWFQKRLKKFFHLMAASLVLGTVMSQYFQFQFGEYLTAAVVVLISIFFWRIYKKPPLKTKFNISLWVSQWNIVLGIVGMALFPVYSIHFFHLFTIGGIGLMALLIATRVVLSHGGFSVEKESQSKVLYWILGLGVLSAYTRLSAGLIPTVYFSHLFYASSIWIVVLALWSYRFGRKIWG